MVKQNSSQQSSDKYPIRNEHYALISTMYHLLQGYDTYLKYEQDVRAAGKEELVTFFQNLQKDQMKWVNEIKGLMKDWLLNEDEGMMSGRGATTRGEQAGKGMQENQTSH